MKNIAARVVIAASIVLAGCGGGGTPMQTASSMPTMTPSARLSPPGSPSPTATPSHAPTATPIASGTPTPTATPSPGGVVASSHFIVNGSTVTGFGTTSPTQNDHFSGAAGATYQITVEAGAKLIAYCDNTAAATAQTTCSSPANQLITFGAGSLTNYGTLNSEPVPTETAGGKSYALTDNVVSIANTGSTPTIVDNYGSIGDDTLSNCSYCGPPGYYGQGDPAALLIAGQATVTNEPSGYLSGYNAFFTESGNGVFNNYGVVFGVNDGILSGYLVTNYENAGIVTGAAGFADIHNYGNVANYGYILGDDYAILAQNKGGTIDDYGGPQVSGITDFEGHPVYNGEILAIPRGATVPNPNPTPIGTPELSGASFEIVAPNVTVTLHDRVIGGTTYFPMILGPMDGGFNGSFANPTASIKGAVIDFAFPDLPAAQANAFKSALAASRTTNANGTFYTGSHTLTYGGVTFPYEWANVPTVEFDGVAP